MKKLIIFTFISLSLLVSNSLVSMEQPEANTQEENFNRSDEASSNSFSSNSEENQEQEEDLTIMPDAHFPKVSLSFVKFLSYMSLSKYFKQNVFECFKNAFRSFGFIRRKPDLKLENTDDSEEEFSSSESEDEVEEIEIEEPEEEKEPEPQIPPIDTFIKSNKQNIIQFKAKDETDSEAKLSGYHALKNGLILAKWAQSKDKDKDLILLNLTDENIIEERFGHEGYWRQRVAKDRELNVIPSIIEKILYDVLLLSLKDVKQTIFTSAQEGSHKLKLENKWVKLTPKKSSFIKEFALYDEYVMIGLIENFITGKSRYYSLHKKKIKKYVKLLPSVSSSLAKKISQTCNYRLNGEDIAVEFGKQAHIQGIHNSKNFISCLDCMVIVINHTKGEIDIESTLEDGTRLKRDYNYIQIAERFMGRVTASGGAINNQEITQIIDLERNMLSRGLTYDLNDVEIVYLFTNENLHEKVENNAYLKTVIQKLKQQENAIVMALINNNNHWSTCLIHKENGKVKYYLADSLDQDLIDNIDIKKTIESINFLIDAEADIEMKVLNKKVYFKIPNVCLENSIVRNLPKEINMVIGTLNNPRFNKEFKQIIPNLMILYGSPGTGKTTLVNIIAKLTGRRVCKVLAADLIKKYYGESVESINEIFEAAKTVPFPVIIFIDEIEAILNTSGTNSDTLRQDTCKKLNYEIDLIRELNEKDYEYKIYCIGATNNFDKLDSSTKSRLGNYWIKIPLPDYEKRLEFIKKRCAIKKIENIDELSSELAKKTEEWSLRDLENAIEDAGATALIEGAEIITKYHLEKSFNDAFEKRKLAKEEEEKEKRKEEESKTFHHYHHKKEEKPPRNAFEFVGWASEKYQESQGTKRRKSFFG